MIDPTEAKRNPAAVFRRPKDIVEHGSLTTGEKIDILRQWRYDALQQEVAQEENMQAARDSLLSEIVEALHALDYDAGDDDTPPTKLGGV
jgi:hypothetical protein